MLLLDFKVEGKGLVDYLILSWQYREIVLHSVQTNKIENKKENIV